MNPAPIKSPCVVLEPFCDEQGTVWQRIRFQHPATRDDLAVIDLDPSVAKNVAGELFSSGVRR